METVDSINALPLTSSRSADVHLLANVAKVERSVMQEVVNHMNVQPTFVVYANVQGRDLGSVAGEIEKLLAPTGLSSNRATPSPFAARWKAWNPPFLRLGLGLIFAAVLVYLLMVVNFQSWLDPFIIITALPGAFVGIVWSLFLWHTTFSVPALMGAIMSIGVATANSILLVTFANEQRREG